MFFKYVNRNSQKKFTPTSLISETGIVTEDPSSILELFGEYFASVFSEPSEFPLINEPEPEKQLIVQFISDESVMHKLNKLDINKSAGPDGITNIVLKSAKQTLTPYLVYLYRLSVSLGEIPKEWKLAQVVPIYKSGDVQRRENYRPVSLTSTVFKT